MAYRLDFTRFSVRWVLRFILTCRKLTIIIEFLEIRIYLFLNGCVEYIDAPLIEAPLKFEQLVDEVLALQLDLTLVVSRREIVLEQIRTFSLSANLSIL